MWTKNISLLKDFNFEIAGDFLKEHGVLGNHHSKGYKFFIEGYIHDVWFDEENFVLKAKSYHSQKKNEKPHLLTMAFQMQPNLKIIECHCSCEVGLSESCHHIIGLAFYLQDLALKGMEEIEESIASTSRPMKWSKPRGAKVIPEAITSVTFYKPTKVERKKNPIRHKIIKPSVSIKNGRQADRKEQLMNLKQNLRSIDEDILLSQLITENETMTVLNYQMTEISEDTGCLPIELPLIDSEICNILISLPQPNMDTLTFEESKELEKQTRSQHSSQLWHQKRKYVFTSSIFGMLCKRTKPIEANFFENLWTEKNLENVKSIQHGRKEEKNARELYERKTGYKVHACGLIIHPYAPHLGTSPDGIVITKDEIGLVEFKCPYSKKTATLKDALQLKNHFLKEDENKKIIVNTTHNYYFQVQGQMLLTGIRWCDLCTYFKLSNEISITRVEFDEMFCYEMYKKLTDFYNVYLEF